MKKIDIKWKAELMTSQAGKTAIVTGSNTGIGYHMALALADKGAQVVLACRNLDKAGKAKAKMIAASPNAKIQIEELDLANLASVKAFATRMTENHDCLDMLINNAGVMIPPASTTLEESISPEWDAARKLLECVLKPPSRSINAGWAVPSEEILVAKQCAFLHAASRAGVNMSSE
jgi:NAD(P)-dependent dehydrogenase (short-subunit alcohol dehydrogenase family)